MEKHIYFVRHGESVENARRVFHDHTASLTENGHAQAARAAERVGKLGIDTVVSSTFPRALDTAQAIATQTGLPIEQSDLFVEWMVPASFRGREYHDPELQETMRQVFGSSDGDYRYEDEETFNELVARVKKAIVFLEQHSGNSLCVVTHGGFLRTFLGVMALQETFSKENFAAMFRRLVVNNTGITYARYDSEKNLWQLITWNDQAHLG
ncbi:MAG: hypothetical protein B7X04_03370 [Parcubacteria group bacterium 21-54-25]|nr:MAG: hypothetical protein B7X04_03370 [Parcubacteria group bacterium 21-54-25]HQU08032.1 histidine phosphatase family protein [Candidatus Paceibacterota bacterium]